MTSSKAVRLNESADCLFNLAKFGSPRQGPGGYDSAAWGQSKLTTYAELSELTWREVFFVTIRRRGLIMNYARRNGIEDGLGTNVNFFHLDNLSSEVRLKIDLMGPYV